MWYENLKNKFIIWKILSREIVGGEAIVTRDLDHFWNIFQQRSPARTFGPNGKNTAKIRF